MDYHASVISTHPRRFDHPCHFDHPTPVISSAPPLSFRAPHPSHFERSEKSAFSLSEVRRSKSDQSSRDLRPRFRLRATEITNPKMAGTESGHYFQPRRVFPFLAGRFDTNACPWIYYVSDFSEVCYATQHGCQICDRR